MAGTSADQRAALGQILELVLLLGDDMERRLAREGLSPARTRVVWMLQQQGPSTQRSIADALDVTPRNVTGLVDGLVGSGFVTRSPHPDDRRATLITLTPRAQQVVDDLGTEEVAFARQLFGAMPDTTFTGLVDGLASILDIVRAELAAEAVEIER
jgi:DNA-binding MarR family transcriptional regulator